MHYKDQHYLIRRMNMIDLPVRKRGTGNHRQDAFGNSFPVTNAILRTNYFELKT